MATSPSADLPLVPAAPRGHALILAGAATAALLIAVAVVAAVLAGSDGEHAPRRASAADGRFSVVVPAGWRAVTGSALRKRPSAPAAALRRADGRGLVLVHRRPALARSARSLTRDLTTQVARRFRGVKPVSARTVRLDGAPAYVYTFARPSAGAVQSIAVVPRAGQTYTLDAVTGADAPGVAAQAGAILRSFDTTDPAPRS
jgi:hypothetical protein